MLGIGIDIITANYAKIVKRQYHNKAATVYMRIKYSWSEPTFQSIWWSSHASVLKKQYSCDRIRLQKFIHNRLSTKKRDKYNYPFKSNKCSRCFTQIEDENHILRCKTASRKALRKQWIQDLSVYLSGPTTPVYVKDSIITKFWLWLEPVISTSVLHTSTSKNTYLDDAVQSQNRIGWDQFVRGRITTKWGYMITRHLHSITNVTTTAEDWADNLITLNFKYVLQMWELRKKEEHGDTPSEIETRKQVRMLEEIIDIKSRYHHWPVVDQHLLPESIQELEEQTSHNMEIWLIRARILNSAHLRDPVRSVELNSAFSTQERNRPTRDSQRKLEIERGGQEPYEEDRN